MPPALSTESGPDTRVSAAPPAPRAELLVVDDDESVLLTLQAILQMEGYAVEARSRGLEAIELLHQRTFDLVLTDLRLDDTDGIAILAEIRRTSPETVAIMLTGYASLETAIKALREGAYDYLVKPCDVEELKATVARGLERRYLSTQLHQRMAELAEANATINELNQGLQKRVDEATAELTAMVEQLRELDRLKSQFLSMASHELKTPLTVISGFLQVSLRRKQRRLQRGYPSEAEWQEEQKADVDQLEVLNAQSQKLAKLVDELLDVSRIESGRLEFHLSEVDVRQLAADVANRMQLTTQTHELSCPSGPGEGATTIVADRDHLEQVLNNLIGNAIKYSPDGGTIEVDVRPAGDPSASSGGTPSAGSGGAGVVLSVRDQGVGIPSSELDAVFSLFYRSRAEGTRQTVSGMGLGLYISKEIVERHGGRIWVESTPGKGSTFFVQLPKEAAVAQTPSQEATAAAG